MDLFPHSYGEAESRFCASIEQLGGERGTWKINSPTESDLRVDHVYWPALKIPHTLLILTSGVHGPESYAGHAIQQLFLREFWPKLKREMCGVFMVHSLNPYGFKNHRRCTETGVNLNRNCSVDPNLYKSKNPGALAMAERFLPREVLKSTTSRLLASHKREGSQVRFEDVPLDDFIKTVSMGQFEFPDGFEFGGFQAEPQIGALTERLREIMPAYRNVIFLDLHTGLGHRGRLHLLSGDKPGCINSDLFGEILRPSEDRTVYDYTPNDQEGFYPTFGSTNDLISELIEPGQRLCALTMEFGTIGHDLEALLKSLNLWLTEHQGGWHGYATPELEREVRTAHLEKFFPSDPKWRQDVLAASHGLFEAITHRLRLV